jgi:hypothetical protein
VCIETGKTDEGQVLSMSAVHHDLNEPEMSKEIRALPAKGIAGQRVVHPARVCGVRCCVSVLERGM